MMTNDRIPHFTVIVDSDEYGRVYYRDVIAVEVTNYSWANDEALLVIHHDDEYYPIEPTCYDIREIRGFCVKQSIRMDKKGRVKNVRS